MTATTCPTLVRETPVFIRERRSTGRVSCDAVPSMVDGRLPMGGRVGL